MKQKIELLEKQIEILQKEYMKLYKAIKSLKKAKKYIEDKEYFKPLIKDLENKKETVVNSQEKLGRDRRAIQCTCKHKYDDGSSAFEKSGSDSHQDYYTCQICHLEN